MAKPIVAPRAEPTTRQVQRGALPMICAVHHRRNSTEKTGGKRRPSFQRATWVLLFAALIFPLSADAQERAEKDTALYEQYDNGESRANAYFIALVEDEVGQYVRRSQVLKKCGYKKEADETDARVRELTNKKLKALLEHDIQSGQLTFGVAFHVAAKGALNMLSSYTFGFRESFAATADLLPARTYESVCKTALSKVREWLGEASK